MATSRRFSTLIQIGAAALMIGLTGAPALAQTTVREVVVEAPQIVHTKLGRTSSGVREEMVSLSHHVKYGDLDLTKTSDMTVLQERVREAARRGCAELQRLYPLETHDPACVKKAVAHAMPQARAAMGGR